MKIKICGLRRVEDIAYANEVKPDFAGFILSRGFRRSISDDEARELSCRLHPEIQKVGVFVNDSPERIVSFLQDGTIDMAQLHGQESEEDILYVKAMTGKPLIKALKVENRYVVEAWLDSAADYLLLDSGTGSGKTFDWRILEELFLEMGGELPKPFFLAGGLNADNLEEAQKRWRPYAVDLSSSVETDGIKDLNKMREVVSRVRSLSEKESKSLSGI